MSPLYLFVTHFNVTPWHYVLDASKAEGRDGKTVNHISEILLLLGEQQASQESTRAVITPREHRSVLFHA